MDPAIAYIGLGSNLNDPLNQVLEAYSAMGNIVDTTTLKLSPLYKTLAVGPGDQPDYINAVAKIKTQLQPMALLDALQKIEAQQKRVRKQHWGPRTIDLDILLYDALCCNEPRLTIPHYCMQQRNFVLAPLLDLEPSLSMPKGQTIKELMSHLTMEGIEALKPKNRH